MIRQLQNPGPPFQKPYYLLCTAEQCVYKTLSEVFVYENSESGQPDVKTITAWL